MLTVSSQVGTGSGRRKRYRRRHDCFPGCTVELSAWGAASACLRPASVNLKLLDDLTIYRRKFRDNWFPAVSRALKSRRARAIHEHFFGENFTEKPS